MPTHRKRIGFLPKAEVQNIIEKICYHNKLSQSKVTGILVEEALSFRGVLSTPTKKISLDFLMNDNEISLNPNKTFNSEIPNDEDNLNLGILDSFFETGSNDVMIVIGNSKNRMLIPFINEEVVKKVDLKKKIISVDWNDGE